MARVIFETPDGDVVLKGRDAEKFLEYDKNPWKYETPESLETIRRAREIAKTV